MIHYIYYNSEFQRITKKQFTKVAPKDWESEVDSYGQFNHPNVKARIHWGLSPRIETKAKSLIIAECQEIESALQSVWNQKRRF